MADTYITCTVSPCQIITTLDVPVLNLDTDSGAIIAGAVLAVWGTAWCFRALAQFISSTDGDKNFESEK